MNHRPLISQSRKYYWRFYRLVALAVVIMMAVLTGSLLLGDSVRGTLVQRVGERLGKTETIIASGTGFMSDTIMHQSLMAHAQGYLLVDGFMSVGGKLLPVYVWGTDADSLSSGEALVNQPLLAKLAGAAEMVLHLPAHNMVPSGSLFVTQSYATQMRLHVVGVKSVADGGNLLLKNEQTLPLNVFVSRQYLAEAMELKGKINVILSHDVIDQQQMTDVWQPEWSGIHLTDSLLTCDGIFIPREIVEKCKGSVYFSYFVNDIISDRDTIPYSFVTAVEEWQGESLDGQDMILSDYAAKRLHVSVGDSVEMSYFIAKDLKNLETNSRKLRVKRIVPLADFMHDSLLTADFPGLSHVKKCTDWDSDLPIKMERVTKADEDFWYAYRQTPKAIVSYEAVSEDWSNTFGNATALRFVSKPAVSLTPGDAGLLVDHPRGEGLSAAKGGVDFASLFLALGCFIILAAILLMKNPLLEMLTLRSGEVRLYRQLGFNNHDIRNLLYREAFSVIFLASPFGVIAGFLYSAFTLWLLGNVWSGATHTEDFALHIQPLTVIAGWLVGLFISAVSLWMVIRRIVRQDESQGDRSMILFGRIARPMPLVLLGVTIVLTSVNFLTLHSLALFIVCGLLWIATWSFFLSRYICRKASNQASDHGATHRQLLWQSLHARMKQHRLAYWTLSMGVFTVFAVGLNRPDVRNAEQASGGWQYYVESRVPIQYDLNSPAVRRKLSLQSLPDSTSFLTFLRHTQDEASCLNLNKVSHPTVLGADLERMEAFGLTPSGHLMSVYLDEEALVWSLKKSVGDTIYYQDGQGETVPVVIAGSYPTGLFHGAAIMSRDEFRRLWPRESGTEVLLMRSSHPEEAADVLATAMSEYGLSVMTVGERLQMFFEVTETYLVIFLTLGAFGLLLGIFSLLIIVRKNLTAQQHTIRLYRTIGFAEPIILQILLREYLLVPLYALAAGATGAVISISANPVGAGLATILISVVVLAALCLILYYGIQHIIKYTINNK
ncbi:MAG: ABC transporter permease [Bacteroidales bacterium]|nr:ABC transporter permease [Bacteroidales bacterium]